MVFDVTIDQGFFDWLLVPVLSNSRAELKEVESVSVGPATNETIADALSKVRAWYNAGPRRIEKSR